MWSQSLLTEAGNIELDVGTSVLIVTERNTRVWARRVAAHRAQSSPQQQIPSSTASSTPKVASGNPFEYKNVPRATSNVENRNHLAGNKDTRKRRRTGTYELQQQLEQHRSSLTGARSGLHPVAGRRCTCVQMNMWGKGNEGSILPPPCPAHAGTPVPAEALKCP